MIKSIGRLG